MPSEKTKTVWFWIRDIFVIILIPITIYGMSSVWKMVDNQTRMITTQQITSETLKSLQSAQSALLDRVRPLELWKAETAGNRFTKSDGYDLAQKSAERDSKLTEQITALANIVAAIPKETPSWLVDRMDKIEARLDRVIQ